MKKRSGLVAAVGVPALIVGTLMWVVPGRGQESILPPGFGDPPPAQPKSQPKSEPRPPQQPGGEPKQPGDGGSRPPATTGGAPKQAPAPRPAVDPLTGLPIDPDDPLAQTAPPPPPRYDLPAGSRRSLSRIGPLAQSEGGLAPDAFGIANGPYLKVLVQETRAPLVSRWASILLRRALLSGTDTPPNVNGADWVAERAALLLRMGEAQAARALIQSVDPDKASPRFIEVTLDAGMATADPGTLCPYANVAREKNKGSYWTMGRSMCSALAGEPGTAGATLDSVRRKRDFGPIDLILAEKVLGAGANARRSVQVKWDDVDRLTPWRFGLATATGVAVPENLYATAGDHIRSWRATAPMIPLADRVAAAPVAASTGVLSARAYVDLVSAAAEVDRQNERVAELADNLAIAHAGKTSAERLRALETLWQDADQGNNGYAAYVLTARAAAAMPISTDIGSSLDRLLAALFAGGFDTRAQEWVSVTEVGSRAWGMLAVGSPRPLSGVDGGTVDDFAGNDDSADYLRTRLLIAGLAGLGRLDGAAAREAAADYDFDLGKNSRWTRAISAAAQRGEQGTVAVLAAVGMQGRGWQRMQPLHLYHIVSALREVGLASEARMIAAEAVARS